MNWDEIGGGDVDQEPTIKKIAFFVFFAGGILIIAYLVQFIITLDGSEWVDVFYKVAHVVIQGGNPYTVFGFYNPPWIIPILLPLSIGSAKYSQSLVFVVSILSATYLCKKMELGVVGTIAYLLSAPSLLILNLGNLEHILLLALFLPPQWGILVLLIKPQIGFGFVLYHAIMSFRQSGWCGLLRLISPATATVMAVSLLVFGYPKMTPSAMPWNISLFPYLLIPALVVLFIAINRKRPEYSLVTSLGFSPYLTMHSFLVVGAGLMKHTAIWMILYCIISWFFQIINFMAYIQKI